MQHFPKQSFLPFMVDAEAGQASDGVSLYQLLQADRTFSCILSEDVLCKTTHTWHHRQSKNYRTFHNTMLLWENTSQKCVRRYQSGSTFLFYLKYNICFEGRAWGKPLGSSQSSCHWKDIPCHWKYLFMTQSSTRVWCLGQSSQFFLKVVLEEGSQFLNKTNGSIGESWAHDKRPTHPRPIHILNHLHIQYVTRWTNRTRTPCVYYYRYTPLFCWII